jgi:hypothetical protein
VHGVAQTDPPAELKLEWDLALFGRDMGEASCMAYWADVVRPEVLQGNATKTKSAGAGGGTLDVEAVLADVNVPKSRKADAQQLAMSLLREMGVDAQGGRDGCHPRQSPSAAVLPAQADQPLLHRADRG